MLFWFWILCFYNFVIWHRFTTTHDTHLHNVNAPNFSEIVFTLEFEIGIVSFDKYLNSWVLKRGNPKMKFLLLFLSAVCCPPFRPTSTVRPGVNSIQWGQSYTMFLLAPGRTSDVGQGQCQEKFFMVGRSVGRRGVGRRTDGSFYFFLEPPVFLTLVMFLLKIILFGVEVKVNSSGSISK